MAWRNECIYPKASAIDESRRPEAIASNWGCRKTITGELTIPYELQAAAKTEVDDDKGKRLFKRMVGPPPWCSAVAFMPQPGEMVRSMVKLVRWNKYLGSPTQLSPVRTALCDAKQPRALMESPKNEEPHKSHALEHQNSDLIEGGIGEDFTFIFL